MSTEPYVSEFLACIRHPVHEAGQESTFHATITQWLPDLGGVSKPHAYGPVTPERAFELGFDLNKIIGEALAAAVLERDAAISRVEKAETERDTAKAEWNEMAQAAQKAAEEKAAAVRLASQATIDKQAAEQREAALVQEIDVLRVAATKGFVTVEEPAKTGPSNPLLNALTFGLAGN